MINKRKISLAAKAIALTGLSLTLPACSTLMRGTTQPFTIESSPPSARASTSNGFTCDSTPCTLRLPRKDGFTVNVSKEGYVSEVRAVNSSISTEGTWTLFGNILFGGLIGVIVDVSTGSANDLTPNPLVVTLQPEAPAKGAE